jgi:hypothetical protein
MKIYLMIENRSHNYSHRYKSLFEVMKFLFLLVNFGQLFAPGSGFILVQNLTRRAKSMRVRIHNTVKWYYKAA